MKKTLFHLLLVFFAVNSAYSQNLRLMGLGGMSYSVEDRDFKLNPYDLGRNPAFIVSDQKDTYLKIIPGYLNESGDYKRRYDPQNLSFGGLHFKGLKPLGADGTFLGEMGYVYEYRGQVSRAITRQPYAGDAFFMVDTTVGNITYSGPRMTAIYSWELTDGLSAGFSAMYCILSGLKSVYTYSKTIFRDADVSAGLTYELTDNTYIGLRYEFDDKQESIEANDVNLLDVELFNYVGDNYALRNRSSTISQKIRRKTHETSLQFYSTAIPDMVIGLNAGLFPQESKFMIPYQAIQELVYGYTQKTDYYADMFTRYSLSDGTLAGIKIGYFHTDCWSKNNRNDLLVWEWEQSTVTAGIGFSQRFGSVPLLAALEFETSLTSIDSSKHIDKRYYSENGTDFTVRGGLEYQLMENLSLRGGYRFSSKEIDLTFGLRDVAHSQFSGGFDYTLSNGAVIQIFTRYSTLSPRDSGSSRVFLEGFCQLKLNSF